MEVIKNHRMTQIFLLAALVFIPALQCLADDHNIALVLRGKTPQMQEVLSGMSADLEDEVIFKDQVVDKTTTANDVKHYLDKIRPSIVVLLGNRAISSYNKYQKEFPNESFPPSLLLAALHVDIYLENIKNATGIRYEIPLVTSAVQMRSIFQKPVKKVGVLYRPWMKDYVATNAEFLRSENIELIMQEVQESDKNIGKQIRKSIKQLGKRGVDAFWVVNDNALLTPAALIEGWIPALSKSRKHVLVGVETLIQSKFNFGNFAIVPDHYSLGVQGADKLTEIMDNDWIIDSEEIEQPVSVKKLINLPVTQKRKLKLKAGAMDLVDQVIE